jgi:hypothetical protein
MSKEVIQYPLPAVLENYPLAKDHRILATGNPLTNPDKCVFFAKVANTLWGLRRRVANAL